MRVDWGRGNTIGKTVGRDWGSYLGRKGNTMKCYHLVAAVTIHLGVRGRTVPEAE